MLTFNDGCISPPNVFLEIESAMTYYVVFCLIQKVLWNKKESWQMWVCWWSRIWQ